MNLSFLHDSSRMDPFQDLVFFVLTHTDCRDFYADYTLRRRTLLRCISTCSMFCNAREAVAR